MPMMARSPCTHTQIHLHRNLLHKTSDIPNGWSLKADDHVNLKLDEFASERLQARHRSMRIPQFQRDVLTFHIAQFMQPLTEFVQEKIRVGIAHISTPTTGRALSCARALSGNVAANEPAKTLMKSRRFMPSPGLSETVVASVNHLAAKRAKRCSTSVMGHFRPIQAVFACRCMSASPRKRRL
jgi:hypothetical protein